jgi:putative endonuclease
MNEQSRALGREGEARAARFLKLRGYRILGRNVRAGGVEMDLIVSRGALVVFVEVKTRRTRHFGAPETAVNDTKQARLVRGAAAWLCDHPQVAGQVRFDVIAYQVAHRSGRSREHWRINHMKGAFDASAAD